MASSAEAGMKRVLWVRVTCLRQGAIAEAFGLGHRMPRTARIPLGRAAELSAAGVPLVIRRSAG